MRQPPAVTRLLQTRQLIFVVLGLVITSIWLNIAFFHTSRYYLQYGSSSLTTTTTSSTTIICPTTGTTKQEPEYNRQELQQRNDNVIVSDYDQQCDELMQFVMTKSDYDTYENGEVNRLRRFLNLSYPSCFEKYFHYFQQIFLQRLQIRKHISLHIPKTAGTSLCNMIKQYTNYTTSSHDPRRNLNRNKNNKNNNNPKKQQRTTSTTIDGYNCWIEYFCPIWYSTCHYSNANKQEDIYRKANMSCQVLDDDGIESTATRTKSNNKKIRLPTFVMNENWLDHPLCTKHHLYSITIRQPIDRVISHVSHYLKLLQIGGLHHPYLLQQQQQEQQEGQDDANDIFDIVGWQLNLIQNNYMTWSLISGYYDDMTSPRTFIPRRSNTTTTRTTTTTLPSMTDEFFSTVSAGKTTKMKMNKPIPPPSSSTATTKEGKKDDDHITLAMETLSRFDFILELSKNSTCDKIIFQMFGFNQTESISYANTRKNRKKKEIEKFASVTTTTTGQWNSTTNGKNNTITNMTNVMAYTTNNTKNHYSHRNDYRRNVYIPMNDLDLELYEYGEKLMKIDCDFFLRVYNEWRK